MTQFMNRPRIAVAAMIAIGIVISISSFSLVRAERIVPTKTFDCTSGTACVIGSSTGNKTWGVYGFSNEADGVHGTTNSTTGNSAVAGFARGSLGYGQGVFGWSANGAGVEGTSKGTSYTYPLYGSGVFGYGTAYGVTGTSPAFVGVYGDSKKGTGVEAVSGGSSSGVSSAYALFALGTNTDTGLFLAENVSGAAAYCTIDSKANLNCTGKIGAPSLRERHRNSSGQHVLSYSSQSATATIEDVGTARMAGGVANVQIDPSFASVMDGKWYYVFLTPLGDTRGLFVSMKTLRAFQVREVEHGRSSLEFDYRIVAHPLDADNERLPLAPKIGNRPNVIHPLQ